jgi:hypothetical protein
MCIPKKENNNGSDGMDALREILPPALQTMSNLQDEWTI